MSLYLSVLSPWSLLNCVQFLCHSLGCSVSFILTVPHLVCIIFGFASPCLISQIQFSCVCRCWHSDIITSCLFKASVCFCYLSRPPPSCVSRCVPPVRCLSSDYLFLLYVMFTLKFSAVKLLLNFKSCFVNPAVGPYSQHHTVEP